MNTVSGPVVADGEGLSVAIVNSRIQVPPPYAKPIADAGLTEVVVGVRPEHLRFSADGALAATVTVVESLGHERHVICRLEDGQMVIVRQPSDESAPGEGSMVRLATDLVHLHVFDAGTQQRIEPA
jgi:multiple sugar transport system ATP-binding protein